ncbi:MAG: ABC transporter substrate-binding protein [Acidobacteriota bacterium]
MSGTMRTVALVALVGALCVACGQQTAPREPSVVRVGLPTVPLALDPHLHNEVVTFQTLHHVYDALTSFDADGRVQAALAESWETRGPTHWRFTLRDGVRFHDGTTLDAGDVVFSLERARAGPDHEIATYLIEIDSVRAIDERTIDVITRVPSPQLLARLAFVAILPGEAPPRLETPIGTGPWVWISADERQVQLRAFDGAWRGRPAFDRAELTVIASPAERVVALLEGRLDVTQTLRPEDSAALEESRIADWVAGPGLQVRYLAMRPTAEPFDDPRVRRAVDLALDRQALVDSQLGGYGSVNRQLVSLDVFGYDPHLSAGGRDLATARRLIEEADAVDARVRLEASRDGPAQIIARQLGEIGLDVEAVELPWDELIERLDHGETDFFLGGVLAVTADASQILDAIFHAPDPKRGYGHNNPMGLAVPELDRLIEESGRALDPRARRDAMRRAMARGLEEHVYLGLYSRDNLFGLRRGLVWRPRLDGFVFAHDLEPAD